DSDPEVRATLSQLAAQRGITPTPAAPPPPSTETSYAVSLLGDVDLHLFNEGRHTALHTKLGAHPIEIDGEAGTYFAVWAPDATAVSGVGDFNGWQSDRHALRPVRESGIWEGFVRGVGRGARYKYVITSRFGGHRFEKADPFAFHAEVPPRTASIVWDLDFEW